MIYDGQSSHILTLDYTGIALREISSKYKKIVCASKQVNYSVDELIHHLSLSDGNVHFSDIKQLIPMKNHIIHNDSKELFNEAKSIVAGHNLTICLLHLKQNSSINLVHTPHCQSENNHEYMLISFEDNFAKNGSKYVTGLHAGCDERSIVSQMYEIRDWLLQRRAIGKPFESGKYPIVFASGVGGIIFHEVIGHQFELSKPYSEYSPIKYRNGYKLGSDNLTVIDAPFILNPKESFDDEGIAKDETILMNSGKIIAPITDKHSINMYPGHTLTGNGRRESFIHYPESRMYRTYVEKGTSKIDEMLSDLRLGFYVEQISYAYCNHRSGTVQFCVNKAKLIKRGKITDIPAIFFIESEISSFLDVQYICNDIAFIPGYCQSNSGGLYVEHGSPTISFNNIKIRSGFTYDTKII